MPSLDPYHKKLRVQLDLVIKEAIDIRFGSVCATYLRLTFECQISYFKNLSQPGCFKGF